MSDPQTPKKPVNRKLAYTALFGLGLIGILGIIAVERNDPTKARDAREARAAQAALERLPSGSEAAAREQLDKQAEIAARRKKDQADAEHQQRAAFDQFAGTPSTANAPPLDPVLLRQLDEAQKEVARKPSVHTIGNGILPPSSGGTGHDGGGGGDAGIVYENYGKNGGKPTPLTGDTFPDQSDGKASPRTDGAGTYEVVKPLAAPSKRVVNQGVMIPAVLMSRIDTRAAGPMIAVVTRTVYDSPTHQVALIPQGSRLVGSYETSVAPGVDRIPATFERLLLPDNRAIVLSSFPTSGLDGTIGVAGKYHSNILRAVGPSFVVAVLGAVVDQQLAKGNSTTASPGVGGTYQAPSVMQQTIPKVDEAVTARYSAAKPYFTVAPGQEIRVILTQDLEIPALGGVR